MGRELPPGRRVGNYAIEGLLEKSGLTSRYAARQTGTDRLCDLTVFHLDPDEEPWNRFRKEVEHLSSLRHPSLIEVLDLGIAHDGTAFLCTEHLPGMDLATKLRKEGALTLPETLAVARQAGAALYAGHGVGVLHRDVRPENLWVLLPQRASEKDEVPEDAGFARIKLLGAGLSRLLETIVSGMALVGSAEYLAPEQVLGHSLDLDPRADQYALAVVLYQCLTTVRPFQGDSVGATLLNVTRGMVEPLRALRPEIPENVALAIARAMSRDRDARFPDLFAFLSALQEGVPLPLGMAELTEPWFLPPEDAEEANRLALLVGAAPQAPLSLGVSDALRARSGRVAAPGAPAPEGGGPAEDAVPHSAALRRTSEPLFGRRADEAQAVPQPMEEQATTPVSMEDVMKLAVPPPKVQEGAVEAPVLHNVTEEVSGESLEIVAEYTEDGRPQPRAGETEVKGGGEKTPHPLPSIIVDLPTRPITDGERLPRGVAAPGDETRLSRLAGGGAEDVLGRLSEILERRASLAERIAWAVIGACLGGLLAHFLG